METRANYLIVGIFVLGLIAALLGFIYWMKHDSDGGDGKAYHVILDGSVQGITVASPVMFNGIRFGAVRKIELLPEDTRKVRILISVRQDTPVRTNSHARISQQGLAGWVAMEITPGTPDMPMLEPKPGEKIAVISADPGASGSLFAGVSDAAGQASALAVRLNNLIANNEDSLHRTVANLETFTGMMAERKDDIAAVIQNVRQLSEKLAAVSAKIDSAVDRLAGESSDNPNSIVSQVQQAAISIRQLSEKLDKSVGDKSGALTQQADRSLREFELLAKDGRRLVDSLDRVVQKIDRNPTGFLLGGQQSPKY
ncbi:Mammalian cell entry related domain protein [Rhodomicrobium vannielii ATCC 17100]|jgi:phospholipid/cholesterol/gamma-HCH transport system substrate-binding protein|uniref:Mammalian cell entry related domain protein n=1 Tax=Rhodomicrobium vannielii (strain ATCC 17100 / DSM 162 / LMG 4299 / NCIMB 10020 / ATH 3.1.1) TaxID=648757 RepID=E3I3Y1_RHOVT|nr:MlaD family protein [Rhodomicrobium vannielii]ADP71544.1 Mammalian cell entry related domain protein [Rhodomicrobium vannielii ATCC 17100]